MRFAVRERAGFLAMALSVESKSTNRSQAPAPEKSADDTFILGSIVVFDHHRYDLVPCRWNLVRSKMATLPCQ